MSRFGSIRFYVLSLSMALAALSLASRARGAVEDFSWFLEIADTRLTPDGERLVYLLTPSPEYGEPARGDVTLIVRDTHGTGEHRSVLGDISLGAGELRMSASGRWIAYRKVAAPNAGSSQTLESRPTLLDLTTFRETPLPEATSFEFVGHSKEWIILQQRGDSGTDSSHLRALELGGDGALDLPGVKDYRLDGARRQLAWVDTRGVWVVDLSSPRTLQLDTSADGTSKSLTWSERGNALAFLRENSAGQALVTFTDLSSKSFKKTILTTKRWKDFPTGFEISADPLQAHGALIWRDDERGLFFGVHAQAPSRSSEKTTVKNLILWHWRDEQLPGERKYASAGAQQPSYLSFVSLDDRRFVRLSDPTLMNVAPHGRGRFVLGYDSSSYRNPSADRSHASGPIGQGNQHRDYYLVDLTNGKRTLLARNLIAMDLASLSIEPQLSPDGQFVVYQENGDYIAHNVRTGQRKNLTAGLPTQFFFDENERNHRRLRDSVAWVRVPVLQGWARDHSAVLISDYYDLWALPLTGGRALNLTNQGRETGITFTRARLDGLSSAAAALDISQQNVELSEPLFFVASDTRTGRTAYARRLPNARGVEILRWEEANVAYYKADRAEIYVSRRETSAEPSDYFLLDHEWQPNAKLTDANPKRRELSWSPGAQYLNYRTTHGDTLQAVLYLPAGYEQGHRYPAVVRIYEGLFRNQFYFIHPGDILFPWIQRGYAVLQAAVQPRVDNAGRAAVEAVSAAVETAIATGIVDQDRLGLMGHSYGGYETSFVVSQTDLFRAAISEAGVSNLWSNYGQLYAGGWPTALSTENTQPFLSGPWWDSWDAFTRNSPLFHARQINTPLLLVHGDSDMHVPFSQSVELFNNLRRLGGKPVVLLQYVGGDHVSITHERDARDRELQFFDHFLKGQPAPSWWSEGASYYQGAAPTAN